MNNLRSPILILACLLISAISFVKADNNELEKKIPGYFESDKALKDFLEYSKLPCRIQEAKTKEDKFICIFYYPTSADVVSLYCYHFADNGGLLLYLKAQLSYTSPSNAKLKETDNFINVICNDKVILKISCPHRSDQSNQGEQPVTPATSTR